MVINDVIYRTKKGMLILIVFQPRFQDSILFSCAETLTTYIVHLLSVLVSFILLKDRFPP